MLYAEMAIAAFTMQLFDPMHASDAGEKKAGARGLFDSMVQALGKAAFFPQFAVFPVKYLDGDMAVFTFPPLKDSLIAVRKTS